MLLPWILLYFYPLQKSSLLFLLLWKGHLRFLWYPDSDTASQIEGFALEQVYKPVVIFLIYPFVFALRADLNGDPYAFFNSLRSFLISVSHRGHFVIFIPLLSIYRTASNDVNEAYPCISYFTLNYSDFSIFICLFYMFTRFQIMPHFIGFHLETFLIDWKHV